MWWAFSRSVMKCAGGTFHSSESPTKKPTKGKADWGSRPLLYDTEKLQEQFRFFEVVGLRGLDPRTDRL